jgi:hypothetical protein
MDPDEALKQLREAMAERDTGKRKRARKYSQDEIVDLFQALDQWLMQGGFLPQDWNR